MGYKDITAGEKVAKALAARFIKSPTKGTPGIEISFEFEEPSTGTRERLNWVGWLSENARQRTYETLDEVLGCNGSEVVDANGMFTDPNFLDYKREVKLVVELEEYVDKNGETKASPKIKWVNSMGGSSYGSCTPEVATSELSALGFKANFLGKNKNQPPPNLAPKKPLPF